MLSVGTSTRRQLTDVRKAKDKKAAESYEEALAHWQALRTAHTYGHRHRDGLGDESAGRLLLTSFPQPPVPDPNWLQEVIDDLRRTALEDRRHGHVGRGGGAGVREPRRPLPAAPAAPAIEEPPSQGER